MTKLKADLWVTKCVVACTIVLQAISLTKLCVG